jgi:hypothetical protein
MLRWVTANEIDTKVFTVEQSTDGLLFTAVANVAAKGRENNMYDLKLSTILTGNNFYRLKMVDNNGRFAYSPVVFVSNKKNTGFSVLINPVKDFIIMNTNDRSLNNTTASIINSVGIIIKTFVIKEGSQAININGLPAGVYYVKTINGSSRVLIQ